MNDDEFQGLPPFVPVRQVADAIGTPYQRALILIREGDFPLPLIRQKKRNFVLKSELRKFLDENK